MTRQFSAGGALFKPSGQTTLWLITKPRPSKEFPKDRFTLPKGQIESEETPEEAAAREVAEETGIKGEIVQKIDHAKSFYEISGEKIFKITTYFLMKYDSGEPKENEEVEKILWLDFELAKKQLSYSSEKAILTKAKDMIDSKQ